MGLAQKSIMDPDSNLYSLWADLMADTSGCNTTELTSCVANKWADDYEDIMENIFECVKTNSNTTCATQTALGDLSSWGTAW